MQRNDANAELSTCDLSRLLELLAGDGLSDADRVIAFRRLAESGRAGTYVHLLPLLLNLAGRPYSLTDHFPFEPFFQTTLPSQTVLCCGRQVSKSTTMAARGLLLANAIPHFNLLFVAPLYEQIRRFSTNYIRPFIEQSPLRSLWCGTGTENSVLQRSFKNYSQLYFSFALTSADRCRGIAASGLFVDEAQDMDLALLPVLRETLSASRWRLSFYSGTPKTSDHGISGLFEASSQAEWAIPCHACRKWNVARGGEDLEKMLGPYREDISEERPGVVCARCGRPIRPREGRWVHRYPERRYSFPGYHVPQIIMPVHYGSPQRWSELLAKREGAGNTTTAQFYNEVLGESYDVSSKLLTRDDLEAASILSWKNNPQEPHAALARKNDYMMLALGADWGGGGESHGGGGLFTMSFTSLAVVGLRPNGQLDVIYGRRLLTPHDHLLEASQVLHVFRMFECKFLVHDYNGAGSLRETFVVQAGVPLTQVIPIVYTRSGAQNIVNFHRSEEKHSRNYWLVDKARSLQLLCQCIKLRHVRFFAHDYVSEDQRGLQSDFLALVEHKVETARGGDVYMIRRNPHFPDDFAHAVNFAACAIWHATGNWPNVAQMAGLRLTEVQAAQVAPTNPWTGPEFFERPN